MREVAPTVAAGTSPQGLSTGDTLGDRFTLDERVAEGGMGVVWRATDRLSGACVAIKVMLGEQAILEDSVPARRFTEEARTLAELHHPSIVEYVAHGRTPSNALFLAMEWIEGEDLGQRLARAPLGIAESVGVIRLVAEGLAVAHRRGIVHRDIKPSNIMLVGGDPARAKLLDFGIARAGERPRALLTRTNTVLGTVGYMAPEQATGMRSEIDARSDVFSLGCVLFECVAGRPVFSGEHAVAILAKALIEEAPRLVDLVPEVPPELDDLVARMLSKPSGLRPADAGEVVTALAALRDVPDAVLHGAALGAPRSVGKLTSAELRVVSIILVERASFGLAHATTLAETELDGEIAPIRIAAAPFGGEVRALTPTTMLVGFRGSAHAVDRALRAARCALAIGGVVPDVCIALATGTAETSGVLPAGPPIDRAATLLRQPHPAVVRVDDVTRQLLDARFELEPFGSGAHALLRERDEDDEIRTLLGKPTPCVGRERELAMLEATWDECVGERVARSVLVTAPPGVGKTRLRHELCARVRRRTEGALVLVARGSAVGGGAALRLARQLVRAAITANEPAGQAPASGEHARLRAHLEGILSGEDLARTAEFLGDMLGAPTTGPPSGALQAARSEPRVHAEWTARSFHTWLSGLTARGPILVVLEDLQWGDSATLLYLRESTNLLAERPLFLFGLARPEVHDVHTGLRSARELTEIPLGGLSRRAAERLVRATLGADVAAERVASLVERAAGNAFYLEELIRRVAEGGGSDLPESVVAMVQSRLEEQPDGARRLLRAAAVYGDAFTAKDLSMLVEEDEETIEKALRGLVRDELFAPVRDGVAGEHAFRNALVRDAAYAALPAADRLAAHVLAGEWLEQRDAMLVDSRVEHPQTLVSLRSAPRASALVIAAHYERGGDPRRASRWLVEAASGAIDANQFRLAEELAGRALSMAPSRSTSPATETDQGASAQADAEDAATRRVMGRARSIRGTALVTKGAFAEASPEFLEALDLLAPGSNDWSSAAGIAMLCTSFIGDLAGAARVAQHLLELTAEPEPTLAYARAMYLLTAGLGHIGQIDLARSMLANLDRLASAGQVSAGFVGWAMLTKAWVTFCLDMDPYGAHLIAREADPLFVELGDDLGLCVARFYEAMAALDLDPTTGLEPARVAGELAAKVNAPVMRMWSRIAEAMLLADLDRSGEAAAVLDDLSTLQDELAAGHVRALSAALVARRGDVDRARELYVTARDRSSLTIVDRILAHAGLARLELDAARFGPALEAAEGGLSIQPHVGWVFLRTQLLVARVEALRGLGRLDEARGAADDAAGHVTRVAATIADAGVRARFVERPWNARAVELGRA